MTCDIGKIEFATTVAKRMRGMLCRPPSGIALILTPCNDIHTFGMRYALDIAFISKDGEVLEVCRSVPSNKRIKKRHAVAVIERFSNESEWLKKGDILRLYTK